MKRRVAAWALLAALAASALTIAAGSAEVTDPGRRGDALAAELRCPVCQGLSVADSESETAQSIQADIARRVEDGQSDVEIRQAYVDRYGEWVLLRPRREGLGLLLWLAPPLIAGVGAAVVVVALWRWQRQSSPPPSEEDLALVVDALNDRRAAP